MSDTPSTLQRKPEWLKIRIGGGHTYAGVSRTLTERGLHTICSSGRCPNQGECWQAGTATFLLLGNICTRSCRFCATPTGHPLAPDPNEPDKIAQSVRILSLKHVVLTSVDRDDLPDGGANHWKRVVEAIRVVNPNTTIEVLIPDFIGKDGALKCVIEAQPEIIAHNIETVERITPNVRSRARYRYSLEVLKQIAEAGALAKSGIMLGLGETYSEILTTMDDLRAVNCQVLTIGQYLQPRKTNAVVQRYVTPDEFDQLAEEARYRGFRYVEAGPLVRSSFHAEKALAACGILKTSETPTTAQSDSKQ